MMEEREKETGNGKKKKRKKKAETRYLAWVTRLNGGKRRGWWRQEKRFDGFESELGSSEAPTHEGIRERTYIKKKGEIPNKTLSFYLIIKRGHEFQKFSN